MFRKVLVPLDGSELAERALECAAQLARELGSSLVLLRVVNATEFAPAQALAAWSTADLLSVAAEDERRSAQEYLERVAARVRQAGVDAQCAVRMGDPAGEIVEYGKANRIDLIVMSTHGRSGLSRWVYGSVADRVLRGGTLPVLLVRAGSAERVLTQVCVASQADRPA